MMYALMYWYVITTTTDLLHASLSNNLYTLLDFSLLYYILLYSGPEEELPRKLDYMEFVMHAPSDYYKATKTPFPPTEPALHDYSGFIWSSLEPIDRM